MGNLKLVLAIGLFCAVIIAPAIAQESGAAASTPAPAPAPTPTTDADTPVQITNPSGTFADSFGTTFTFSLCGEGTDLCGVLNEVKGKSRTEENLVYIDKQVMQASQTAPNQWKGTVIFNGSEAAATITQTGPDTIEIQGCRVVVLCQTLVYNRV